MRAGSPLEQPSNSEGALTAVKRPLMRPVAVHVELQRAGGLLTALGCVLVASDGASGACVGFGTAAIPVFCGTLYVDLALMYSC